MLIKGLYCITPENIKFSYEEIAENVCRANIDILQFRNKILNDNEFYKISLNLRNITLKYNVKFIINDRCEIALRVNADGIHLGQRDLIEKARYLNNLKEKNMIIGISTHNIEEINIAKKYTPDYISIGPIFPTPLKPEYMVVGVEFIKKVKKLTDIPIVTIGGINENNIEDVLKNGADAIAVIRAIFEKNSLDEMFMSAERLKNKIKKYDNN